MKKILIFLGSVLGLIIVFFLAQLFYAGIVFLQEGGNLDAETKAWVDETIPPIIATWDSELLRQHSSKEALETVPPEVFDSLMETFSDKFGNMDEYLGSEGEGGININNFEKNIGARYTIKARYGEQIVRMYLVGVKEEGAWKIYGLNVDFNTSANQ